VHSALRGSVVPLLKHPQGSRVVQAALAELPAGEAASLAGELDGHVLECALDTHGSWGVCVAFRHTHAPFLVAQERAGRHFPDTSQSASQNASQTPP